MKGKKIFFTTFVFMFLLASFWVRAEETGNNPVAVSPGSETEVVTVWQSCPTFSWSAVDQAASYQLAIFESPDGKIATYESMVIMATPVVSKQIPGPALSWTIPAEEKLKTGDQYAWYVQALDANGNALGSWSGGRIFKVEQEVRFAGIAEELGDILKSYGVNDETASNVLNDLTSVVKEVEVRNGGAGIKNSPSVSRVQGYEGDMNTYYGLQAGAANTTGYQNSYFGRAAGLSNTTGAANTFLGYNAGLFNISGSSNTFIGAGTGTYNTTGGSNTFVGNVVGYHNTTGSENTFLGNSAGFSNTTGSWNIFIGDSTGVSNTTGFSNTFTGNDAGNSNSTGYENTFLGYRAGKSNTTGWQNIFIGTYAGNGNTTGYRNIFLGYSGGYANTTGSQNIFIGFVAGYANTTGYENTFVGNYTGVNNTTGDSNVFFGQNSGNLNTTGYSNTFLGNFSGLSNTSGNNNSFLGYRSGENNSTGYENTYLGIYAGANNSEGNFNTCIGSYAGITHTGFGNVLLGYKSGYYENGSNKLYIANSDTTSPLIYGEFDNSLLKINGNLRVAGYLSLDNGATQINSTEINLLHGKTSVSTGSTDNDKLVTKGYVDENDDVGGGGLTGSDMSDTYICKWDDANTRLVDSLISESPGVVKINGKLGIGTSAPTNPIEVETTSINSCILVKRTDGATNYINATDAYANFGSTTNHPLRLVVNSAWKMRLNQDGSLSMSNGASLTTGGVWTNASSRALKENIESLSTDEAMDALTRLNPVKYNYKVDKTDKHVGFIAEDVPDLVASTDRKGLSPMDVTAVLTKVVQELQKENQEYKKIISDLQERIAKLEKNNDK